MMPELKPLQNRSDEPLDYGKEAVSSPPPSGLSDEEIVQRVLNGDTASFEMIMRRYNQRLYRIVRGMLGDDTTAEDVVQQAYLRAFHKLSQFEGRSRFSTWLTKISVNEALACQQKQKRMSTFDPDHVDSICPHSPSRTRSTDGLAEIRELAIVLTEAIEKLPSDLRTVFVLRVVEHLDTRETAQCLDLTESNIKTRLHRARTQLQADIDRRIGAEVRRLYQFGGEQCDRLVSAVMRQIT